MLTQKYPEQIPDLLGYHSLIIEVHLQYKGDNWLAYDSRLCLSAAANHNIVWAHIDQAYSGKAKASRCKYCFSNTHQAPKCAWVPEYPTLMTQPTLLFAQWHPSLVCFK